MCLGLDPGLEGEEGDQGNQYASGDKPNLNLPGKQQEILEVAYATGKPIVLVLLSGSALAVTWADEHIPAILQGWYPGAQGGRAIAKVLFGEKNPEGKMPLTFYRTTEELPEFTDYAMKGRTYRYMTNEALYPFGYGLSYTTFTYADAALSTDKVTKDGAEISVTVSNTGNAFGVETVQVYVKAEREGTPNAQLKGIAKVSLQPGEQKRVTLKLPAEAFALYDEEAVYRIGKGKYQVSIGTSQPESRSEKLTEQKVSVLTMQAEEEIVLA